MIRQDCRYMESHEWVRMEGDVALIGITHHAQEALGDITYVDLPKVGTVLEREEELGTIESVKAASDLFSPVSGKVIEVNPELDSSPELINQDPYGKGWLIKVAGVTPAALQGLLDAAGYAAVLESEA